ncbi:hypothetical protein [Halarchaeum sp. P4]|uniref:hypothetical protein n=1 Tax=Halarchaeum sp. P4 TaxID=3421639 RepID=UPI003EB95BC3
MTDDESGEVAVQQNGQETAIDAPGLEGQIHVDLDGEHPTLHIPSKVSVGYWDDDDVDDEAVAADGGTTTRREIEMRGFGLQEEHANIGLFLAVVLLAASGAFLGSPVASSGLAGLAMLAGGVFVGYVSVRSRWSDPA